MMLLKRLGGATRAVRRFTNRSMMMDRASTEHTISGQIGQPAACMMDSKVVLSAGCATAIMACALAM
jgi:hypothetical protein